MKSNYYDSQTRSIVSLDREARPNGLTISRVSVLPPHRRQGLATSLLRRLIDDADNESVTLFLEPIPSAGECGPNRRQLIRWYESLGFKPYPEELGFVWYRLPRKRGGVGQSVLRCGKIS
jgi:GNAT superfamily N-acetyltransferase